ncbi:LacI family DNA-binding transcriptional regulator [Streptomyces sp. NPDC051320]|uniref:LacI family DNA-binding transcriptional regulator n=1 Tax=Streptomyces sp. NPDC051320 TaxID=3154644 RepID=UPI00344AC649
MAKKQTPQSGGRATVRDVAARAGVSPATVSRVLGGTYPVASATRTKVQRAMRDLDYVVNAQARALSGGTTKTVAFIVDDVTGAFYAHIARGVEEQAAQEGRLCLLCTTQGDPERVLAVVELMREQRADAVIVVGGAWEDPVHHERMTRFAYALEQAGSRLVLVGRPPLGEDVPATVVNYDNEGGAYAATSHLLAAGHRKVVYAGAMAGLVTSTERLRGFRRAHRAHGFEADASLIVPGDFSRADGRRMIRELLARNAEFTAVMAATDVVAAGVLLELREAGLRVPADVAVVGYDDIPLASDLYPALTTVHVPQEELGRTAVRLALQRDARSGAREQQVTLGTHVVVRESAPPPGSLRI